MSKRTTAAEPGAKGDKPTEPLPEELLNKMIDVLEGPANRLAERVLSSRIVLAPVSIGLMLTFRAAALAQRMTGLSSKAASKPARKS
jgi:hypothetical protein